MKSLAAIYILALVMLGQIVSAQTLFPTSSTTYVAAYKEGFSCYANAYKFYTLTPGTGILSASPFSVTDTNVEINGIGLNTDGYGYGIQYDRSPGFSCTFSNYRLIRFDSAGTIISLGAINPPLGGTSITSAVGFVVPNNRFVMFAVVGNTTYMGFINNILSLSASNAMLSPQYFPLTFNCPGGQYADFAINPIDGNFYTYGIYQNGASYEGTVMKLDVSNQTVSCVGTTTTGLFVANDNFGGVMFDDSGNMYGLNTNNKKFYSIDISTGTLGNLTYISTFPASSGAIRGDLGSNAIGNTPIALPLSLLSFSGKRLESGDHLEWKMATESYSGFEIQYSYDGQSFSKLGSVAAGQYEMLQDNSKHYVWYSRNMAPYYRLKIIDQSGQASYSGVVNMGKISEPTQPNIYPNPSTDKLIVELPEGNNTGCLSLNSMIGSAVYKFVLNNTKSTLDLSNVAAGVYFAVIQFGAQKIVQRIMVRH